MAHWFRWSAVDGDSVHAGEFTVVPRARILSVRVAAGGFAWQLPTSVRVTGPGGTVERLPILDVTLMGRLVLVGAVVAAFAVRLLKGVGHD